MNTKQITATVLAALGTFAVLLALIGANLLISHRLFILSDPDSLYRSTCGAIFVIASIGLTLLWKWAVFEPAFERFVRPAIMDGRSA